MRAGQDQAGRRWRAARRGQGWTPWGARRIGLGGAHLLFGRMHEDAAVDEAVLAGARRVFAIASAGDTALHLARQGRRVTAVDVHPAQVAYVRARAAGHGTRHGSVDRLLAGARLAGRLAGWNQELLRRFLLLDDPQAQTRAFDQLLDTRRCRALLSAGLHPVVLRLGYAALFASGLPQPFAPRLRQRLRAGFATHPNHHNPYAWRLLLGVDGPDRAYRRQLAAAVRHAGRPGAPVVLRTFRDARNQDEARCALRDRALLWGGVIVAAAEDLPARIDWKD
jgi:Protein of unknown function (DUF3419)